MLHLYQLNRSDMLDARKIQEFVMFISRSFPKYPREAFFPFIYEYNISMNPPTLIQWWTEIIIQLKVLPQILSQVLTNVQNAKKKKKQMAQKKKFFFFIIRIGDAGCNKST